MRYQALGVGWKATAWAVAAAVSLAACEDDPAPARKPPPPAPARDPGACDGPGKVNDPDNVTYFPKKTDGFCLDPNGSDQAYGKGAEEPLDAICKLFDGECEIYKRHGVERVVEVRYVDGGGSGATIDVYLSRYDASPAAYAMFTKRVVGDGDPGHPDTPDPIEGGGRAALGIGNAYLWKGPHLAEITYNDTGASSAEQVEEKADALLPALVKAMGDELPGEGKLPEAARALPEAGRLDLGIRHLTDELLGVEGTGPGAYGYYADGEERWRILAIVKDDVAQAEDVLATFGKLEGAAEEETLGEHAVRVMITDRGPKTEWLLARKGSTVLGIGDESRVLTTAMSPEQHRTKTLSQDDKRKRLEALVREESK